MNFAGPRAFARQMLAGDRLALRPVLDRIQATGEWTELVLYRAGRWQVELVVIRPNVVIPKHRHLRVDSCDVALGGAGSIEIGQRPSRPFERAMRGAIAANLVRVPKGEWHGGAGGEQGGVFLSFQEWDGEPGFITEDWQAW